MCYLYSFPLQANSLLVAVLAAINIGRLDSHYHHRFKGQYTLLEVVQRVRHLGLRSVGRGFKS